MKFHEVSKLFPLIEGDEFESLVADIKINGLREPIWTLDDQIVDGRNRYRACLKAGVVPRMREWKGKGSLVEFIVSLNLHRRHLTLAQRTAVSLELEPMFTKEAKERQAATNTHALRDKKGRFQPVVAKLPGPDVGRARDKAAKATHVSPRSVSNLKKAVLAAPELLAEVKGGRLNIQEARNLAELPEARRAAVVDRVKAGQAFKAAKKEVIQEAKQVPVDVPPLPDRCKLIVGDLLDAYMEIPEASVDAIITDPPYPREFLPAFEKLATVAMRCLKPGGSLLVMSGQSYLPEVFEALRRDGLTYQWMLAYLTSGGQAPQIWQRKVNTFWKPVLWFIKGKYEGDWVGDVTSSAAPDKRFHAWGQSESGMADLIERFTYPGQTILDPFLGGGTTGIVAVRMGRSFVGIDSEATAVEAVRARFAA